MARFYDQFIKLHSNVNKACECIIENKCENLSSDIESIKTMLGKVTLNSWQDRLGTSFRTAIVSMKEALTSISGSIDSTFVSSEGLYMQLKDTLDELKIKDSDYQTLVDSKPYATSYADPAQYDSAYASWSSRYSKTVTRCGNLVRKVHEIEEQLNSIDTTTLDIKAVDALDNIDVSSTFRLMPLPTSMVAPWIMKYTTTDDVFTTPFIQGEYDDVLIGRRSDGVDRFIKTSGCGFCSEASAISCVLTSVAGTAISIDPRQLKEILLERNEHQGPNLMDYYNSNIDYNWSQKTYNDVTRTFPCMSVIKLRRNEGGVFTEESLQHVTDAGGAAQISLLGRPHVIVATKSAGNGGWYVNDSDRGNHAGEVCDFSTAFTRSDGVTGKLQGKEAAIYIPNSNFDIDPNSGVVTGINAEGLDVEYISICGRDYPARVEGENIVLEDVGSLITDLGAETVSI